MKFEPISDTYNFKDSILVESFPKFFDKPLLNWTLKVMSYGTAIRRDGRNNYYVLDEVRSALQVYFREEFPRMFTEFFSFVLLSQHRTANFLAFCLQNYASKTESEELEWILSTGGSGYKVITKSEGHIRGGYDLAKRVDPIVVKESSKALKTSEYIKKAWDSCYSRNPDYENVVKQCQEAMELLMRDRYEPNNKRPQIGKLLGNLKTTPAKLKFVGDNILTDKSLVIKLIDNIASYRGMHTSGTGKIPNKSEAEYFLHTAIYIWNLHNS